MRIDRNAFNIPRDFHPKIPSESELISLPKTSGIEKKADKTLFQPENKKIIENLAKTLGVPLQFPWMLHDEKTAKKAGEIMRTLLIKLMDNQGNR